MKLINKLIRLLGGYTETDIKSAYIEGGLGSALGVIEYTQEIYGLPAEEWSQKMYEYIEANKDTYGELALSKNDGDMQKLFLLAAQVKLDACQEARELTPSELAMTTAAGVVHCWQKGALAHRAFSIQE